LNAKEAEFDGKVWSIVWMVLTVSDGTGGGLTKSRLERSAEITAKHRCIDRRILRGADLLFVIFVFAAYMWSIL
jgi:hypothetical protein